MKDYNAWMSPLRIPLIQFLSESAIGAFGGLYKRSLPRYIPPYACQDKLPRWNITSAIPLDSAWGQEPRPNPSQSKDSRDVCTLLWATCTCNSWEATTLPVADKSIFTGWGPFMIPLLAPHHSTVPCAESPRRMKTALWSLF